MQGKDILVELALQLLVAEAVGLVEQDKMLLQQL